MIVSEQMKWALAYLDASSREQELKKSREGFRDSLKSYIMSNGEPDENGNLIFEFPSPVCIDGVWFKGLMAQRRVSEFMNEQRARELIESHSLEQRCVRKILLEEIDYDELYAANQEGIISDDEIDSILELEETYALSKVKQ